MSGSLYRLTTILLCPICVLTGEKLTEAIRQPIVLPLVYKGTYRLTHKSNVDTNKTPAPQINQQTEDTKQKPAQIYTAVSNRYTCEP